MIAKSISKTVIGTVVAVLVFFVAWLLLSALYTFIGRERDEGLLWYSAMKDILAPGFASYIAIFAVEHFLEGVNWRVSFGLFVAAIAALAVLNLTFIFDFYLQQGRTSDWNSVLVSTVLSAIAAVVGAFFFCRNRWCTNANA